MTCLHVAMFCGLVALGADVPADYRLGPPPGQHLARESAPAGGPTFSSGSPLIATTYFYWYDAATNAHIVNGDGSDALTDHPPTLTDFSYTSVAWHDRQLCDMMAAGIDVLLPVYWGTPLSQKHWSDTGLGPLVTARQRRIDAGDSPPAIGMFYDTSTLRHNEGDYHVDLTTPSGRLWFYGTIRNFWSQIPPQHRAQIDGRPLVFLYASAFAQRVDETLFPAVRELFRHDFGTDLFLVKMRGWPGDADGEYQWGGALRPQFLDVAGLGPGYDHSAVPGRAPLVRPREDGRFYRRAWQQLLTKPITARPWLVHVETWNEFHEGTEICESREYGRKYIELTREFADAFHAGRQLPRATTRPTRRVATAAPGRADGLAIAPMPDGDGPVDQKTIDGRAAWSTREHRFSPTSRYLYFEVDDEFLFDTDESVELTVVYRDAGPASFRVEYDSNDPRLAGLAQQFRPGPNQPIRGTNDWKEARFVLPHARFSGLANGADFRLSAVGGDLLIASVRLRLLEP